MAVLPVLYYRSPGQFRGTNVIFENEERKESATNAGALPLHCCPTFNLLHQLLPHLCITQACEQGKGGEHVLRQAL